MPLSSFSLTLLSILRLAQLVIAIICLGLAAETVNSFTTDAGYLVFVSAWTLLALVYLVFAPSYWPAAVGHRLMPFGVEILTNVFWFTAFIVMASIYGPGSCSYYDDYYDGYYYYWGYYSNTKTACEASKAAIAFAAVTWVLFVLTSLLMSSELFGTPAFFKRTGAAAAAGAAGGPTDVEAVAGAGEGAADSALAEKTVGEPAPILEPAVPVPAYSSPQQPAPLPAETAVVAPADSAEPEKPV
ncbi:membrane-associating domain-containing protein [Lipomyces kononenkoae]|uniref:Membrane-associating domain-containing protein n=1 Tax=Lipomyces kononenkoae TaxID=34357 RepID=A0ACC3TBE9_LIPKO